MKQNLHAIYYFKSYFKICCYLCLIFVIVSALDNLGVTDLTCIIFVNQTNTSTFKFADKWRNKWLGFVIFTVFPHFPDTYLNFREFSCLVKTWRWIFCGISRLTLAYSKSIPRVWKCKWISPFSIESHHFMSSAKRNLMADAYQIIKNARWDGRVKSDSIWFWNR